MSLISTTRHLTGVTKPKLNGSPGSRWQSGDSISGWPSPSKGLSAPSASRLTLSNYLGEVQTWTVSAKRQKGVSMFDDLYDVIVSDARSVPQRQMNQGKYRRACLFCAEISLMMKYPSFLHTRFMFDWIQITGKTDPYQLPGEPHRTWPPLKCFASDSGVMS